MDIHKHEWINKLLEHCGGPDLKKKLVLEPIEGGKLLGLIDQYYVQRYGFSQGKKYILKKADWWIKKQVYVYY